MAKGTSQNQSSITLCISGAPSPTVPCPVEGLDQGKVVGALCAQKEIAITTTTTTGFPLWAGMACTRDNGMALAFSPAASASEHDDIYHLPTEGFSKIIYTGFGTSGASILALRSSDAILFGCGGMSSILECMTAIEEKKPIGILEGPWDIDETLKELLDVHYPKYEHLFSDTDPNRLIDQLVKRVRMSQEK